MANLRLVGAIILCLLFSPIYVFAQDLMHWQEVERLIDSSPNKELKAYFQTVDRGVEIKTHEIVLRGIMKQPGFNIIMFVMSSPVNSQMNNPVVAGMSGSPVYLDGKLIGALAYGFSGFASNSWWWGGIQPIHSMIEQAESGLQRFSPKSFSFDGMGFEPIAMGYKTIPGLESIGKFIISNNSSQSSSPVFTVPAIKAGMPIVVDLIEWTDEKGESSAVSAMGTITYIDAKGKIYAFGHPFLDSRKVIYSFRTAEVMGTVYSQDNSFKLTGKKSGVLGAITFDASHGISGVIAGDELKKLHHFDLKFKNEGKSSHEFDIKVANSVLTPMLAQAAFKMIGDIYGAPLPQEASVTQIDSKISLDKHQPIAWKELFSATSGRFGPNILYSSSYEVAYQSFFANVYSNLFVNDYDLKITDVSVSVDFSSGKGRIYKLGYYKFPNKVVYGQDPELEIMLVDQNNSRPIAKKIKINIDWANVEKPVYTKDTMEIDKTSEKRVTGSLGIYSSEWFASIVGQSGNPEEKQLFTPEYFLGADDFIENLNRLLISTSQKIYLRVALKGRSGFFEERAAKAENLMPSGVSENDRSWYVIDGGLKTRRTTLANSGSIVFYPELPSIPSGYTIDRNMRDGLIFEVVSENK
jgi:hypothetical protein